MSEFRINAGVATLRRYRSDDVDALQSIADDPGVAGMLRDIFPNPYTRNDAEEWITRATGGLQENSFAIETDGELAGGAGFEVFKNEARVTAEIGYWLGRRFWGRGIATAAVGALVPWVFDRNAEVIRLEACIYHTNPASVRVLEKNGFIHEATLRRSITKNGQVLDQLVYVRFRDS